LNSALFSFSKYRPLLPLPVKVVPVTVMLLNAFWLLELELLALV